MNTKLKKTIIVPRPNEAKAKTKPKKNAPRIRLMPEPVFFTKRLAVCELRMRGEYDFIWLYLGIWHDKKGYCNRSCQPVVSATVSAQRKYNGPGHQQDVVGYELEMLTAHERRPGEGYVEELLKGLKKYLDKPLTLCEGKHTRHKATVILPEEDDRDDEPETESDDGDAPYEEDDNDRTQGDTR